MDRQIVYPLQQPLETHVLQPEKNALLGLGDLAAGTLGLSDVATGFSLSATSPASLSLVMAPGNYYTLQTVDATAYSSLGTDSSKVVKQGRNQGGTLTFAAPGTVGQSINYLVQAKFVEADEGVQVLPYYNSANPSQAFAGPGGDNTSQPTSRNCKVTYSIKAGTAATTGSQTTPAPDAGFSALWAVTVANGATTIDATNVSVPSGSIINRYSLPAAGNSIATVIAAAGISINPADFTQLLAAIRLLSGGGTGDFRLSIDDTVRFGEVRANDGTIGSAASGATARANADTIALYRMIWNKYSNADAPVTGGRGASADADFAANKPIQLLKIAGRVLGNAGNNGTTNRLAGSAIGSDTATLVAANLPPHPHKMFTDESISSGGDPGAADTVPHFSGWGGDDNTRMGKSADNRAPSMGITGDGPGASTAFSIAQPTFFHYVFFKL